MYGCDPNTPHKVEHAALPVDLKAILLKGSDQTLHVLVLKLIRIHFLPPFRKSSRWGSQE